MQTLAAACYLRPATWLWERLLAPRPSSLLASPSHRGPSPFLIATNCKMCIVARHQSRAWRAREGSIVGSDRLLESFCAVQGSYTRAWPRDSDEEEILSILVSVTLFGLCDFSHTPTTPCCCLTHRTFRRRYDCTTWVSRNWCNAAMPPSLRARWEDTSVWRALDT